MSLEMPASVNVNPKSADAHPPATYTRACATATPNGYPELVQTEGLHLQVRAFAGNAASGVANSRCSYCAIHIAAQACGRGCCAAAAESGRIILATPATPWHISQEALAAAE
jgi:hypothetical protein